MRIKDGSIAKNEVFIKAMDDVQGRGQDPAPYGPAIRWRRSLPERPPRRALVKMAAESGVKTFASTASWTAATCPSRAARATWSAAAPSWPSPRSWASRSPRVSGRYYAMDRDKRWERVQKAYDAMVNASDADDRPRCRYQGLLRRRIRADEFVEPVALDERGIHEGDAVIFFNFRPDRAREITRAFVDEAFDGFERERIQGALRVPMTEYDPISTRRWLPQDVPRERAGRRPRRQRPEPAAHRRDREVRPCDVLPQRRHRGAQGGRGARARRPPRWPPTICSPR